MPFKIQIKTTNDAFHAPNGDLHAETAAILKDVALLVESGRTSGTAFDRNGNNVGSWSLS